MRKRIKKLWFKYWDIWDWVRIDVWGRASQSGLGYIIGFFIFPIAFPIYVFFNY